MAPPPGESQPFLGPQAQLGPNLREPNQGFDYPTCCVLPTCLSPSFSPDSSLNPVSLSHRKHSEVLGAPALRYFRAQAQCQQCESRVLSSLNGYWFHPLAMHLFFWKLFPQGRGQDEPHCSGVSSPRGKAATQSLGNPVVSTARSDHTAQKAGISPDLCSPCYLCVPCRLCLAWGTMWTQISPQPEASPQLVPSLPQALPGTPLSPLFLTFTHPGLQAALLSLLPSSQRHIRNSA